MQLDGSCHCGAVHFSLSSSHPYPFNYCYCSVCRKTMGAGGFAINLGGEAASLKIEGEENISVYQAALADETGATHQSPARRHFCKICGSGLWLYDPRWPDLIHPFASAIDTELPATPERTHLMLGSKKAWVPVDAGARDKCFDGYPDESIADWHKRLGLES
ncbi:MAG: GFA family protein [Alphaproteobacteria bacterium]|nr:MAG: GFA family protein [Alphaproteobacteria bacterium]